jgi:hypothetical protein
MDAFKRGDTIDMRLGCNGPPDAKRHVGWPAPRFQVLNDAYTTDPIELDRPGKRSFGTSGAGAAQVCANICPAC